MKILTGSLKGRNFYMPKGIRPTQDKARKAIFDIIGHNLEDLSFLDLFAGSGAVGIEAISNGAKRVIFVERETRYIEVIQGNLNALNIECHEKDVPLYFTICCDVFPAIKRLSQNSEKFDIVFADPPFGLELAKKTLKTLKAYDIVGANSWLIIQHEKQEILPKSEGRFLRVRERKYGSSLLSFYKISES